MLNPTGVYDRVLRRLSRRDLMKVAWALGASAVALPAEARRQSGVSMFFNSYPFSLGVASGDPLPDGIVLWTRLAPQPLDGGGMPMVPVTVQWELAADAAFRTVVQKGETLARPELAHSVHVEVTGSSRRTSTGIAFAPATKSARPGARERRLRPAPPSTGCVSAICGCSHYETGYFTAYRRIAQEQFDFVIHTGDYIYESRADGGRNEGRVRQHTGDEIYTLVDYRNRYGLYKSDPDLIAAHRSAPFIVSWDDHEVENNYAGDLDENGTPAAIFLLRRAAAYQAYYEHMPLRMAGLADRRAHAHLPAAAVRQPDRSERARHAPVALRSGVQRRLRRPARPRWIRRGRCSARNRRSGSSTTSRTRRRAGRCCRSRSTRSPATS